MAWGIPERYSTWCPCLGCKLSRVYTKIQTYSVLGFIQSQARGGLGRLEVSTRRMNGAAMVYLGLCEFSALALALSSPHALSLRAQLLI